MFDLELSTMPATNGCRSDHNDPAWPLCYQSRF